MCQVSSSLPPLLGVESGGEGAPREAQAGRVAPENPAIHIVPWLHLHFLLQGPPSGSPPEALTAGRDHPHTLRCQSGAAAMSASPSPGIQINLHAVREMVG